jgi:uncharacterized protein (DUF58 family)
MTERRLLPVSPTANFAALLFVLGAMWYSAANHNNAAAYLLLFALTSLFLVSIPHTLLNLGGLKATAESMKPAFAGQEVSLPIEIMNPARVSRRGVIVSLPGSPGVREQIDDIPANKAARVVLRFAAPSRGEHEIERLCLTSAYPLGFLRASKQIEASQRYLVYPKPAGDPTFPSSNAHSTQERPQSDPGGGDDFSGTRAYVPGESQRHIDWKAVARGQPLMTKLFTAEASGVLYLDFAAVRFSNPEDRLSQLALWVIEAERARRPYGLRLPTVEIMPSLGTTHFHRCLRTLALFK